MGWPDSSVTNNQFSSATLSELAMKARDSISNFSNLKKAVNTKTDINPSGVQIAKREKGMQCPGTDAIRTKAPLSKRKWKIPEITISQNRKRTYGIPNDQLSPKRWPLSYLNLTKYHLDT